jgi:predicted kinase
MATLHLLYGGVGTGKTAFAKKLERELPAARFTHDEWTVRLYGSNPPAENFQEAASRVWELIWERAERVLRIGTDVILDGGFWSRASRDDARRRAAALGVPCRFYVLDCPPDVARRRALHRTAEMPPGALHISNATIDVLNRRVEPLGPDEEHITVDSGGNAE